MPDLSDKVSDDEVTKFAVTFTPCYGAERGCHKDGEESCADGCEWAESIARAIVADRRTRPTASSVEAATTIRNRDETIAALRAEVLEEAAKVAANFVAYTWRGRENDNTLSGMYARGNKHAMTQIAAAIRALASPHQEGTE